LSKSSNLFVTVLVGKAFGISLKKKKKYFPPTLFRGKTLNNGYPENYGIYFKSGTSSLAVTGIKHTI